MCERERWDPPRWLTVNPSERATSRNLVDSSAVRIVLARRVGPGPMLRFLKPYWRCPRTKSEKYQRRGREVVSLTKRNYKRTGIAEPRSDMTFPNVFWYPSPSRCSFGPRISEATGVSFAPSEPQASALLLDARELSSSVDKSRKKREKSALAPAPSNGVCAVWRRKLTDELE